MKSYSCFFLFLFSFFFTCPSNATSSIPIEEEPNQQLLLKQTEVETLLNDTMVTVHLGEYEWKFFKFEMTEGNTLNTVLNNKENGHIFGYLNYQSEPTNDSELIPPGWTKFPLEVNYGTWFIGLWAGFGVPGATELTVFTSVTCPNECSERGICDSESQECKCNPGYFLPDCYPKQLFNNQHYTFTDASVPDTYGFILLERFSLIQFNFENNKSPMTDPDSPYLDFYLKYSGRPSLDDYDIIVPFTSNFTTFSFEYWDPDLGFYYILFVPRQQVDISFNFTWRMDCKRNCSHNGVCNQTTGECICDSPYDPASYCRSKTLQINNGEVQVGTIWPGNWDYWVFDYEEGMYLVAKFNQTNPEGGNQNRVLDIYIRNKEPPTAQHYRASSLDSGGIDPISGDIILLIPDIPLPSKTVFIGVHNNDTDPNSQAEYSLVVFGTNPCPNYCSYHGDCRYEANQTTCLCDPAYNLDPLTCTEKNTPIKPGEPMVGVVAGAYWNFYKINITSDLLVNGSNSILLEISIDRSSDNAKASLLVFLKCNGKPTTKNYDEVSTPEKASFKIQHYVFPTSYCYVGMLCSNPDSLTDYNVTFTALPTHADLTPTKPVPDNSKTSIGPTKSPNTPSGPKWKFVLEALGAAIGGAAVLIAFLAVYYFYRRNKQKNLQYEPLSLDDDQDDENAVPKL